MDWKAEHRQGERHPREEDEDPQRGRNQRPRLDVTVFARRLLTPWSDIIARLKTVQVNGALAAVLESDEIDVKDFEPGSWMPAVMEGRYALEDADDNPLAVIEAFESHYGDKPDAFFDYAHDPLLDLLRVYKDYEYPNVMINENDARVTGPLFQLAEQLRTKLTPCEWDFLDRKEFLLGPDDKVSSYAINDRVRRVYTMALYLAYRARLEECTTTEELLKTHQSYARRLAQTPMRFFVLYTLVWRPTWYDRIVALSRGSQSGGADLSVYGTDWDVFHRDQLASVQFIVARSSEPMNAYEVNFGAAQAAGQGNRYLLEYLLDQGADVTKPAILDSAVSSRNVDLVNFVCARGARPNLDTLFDALNGWGLPKPEMIQTLWDKGQYLPDPADPTRFVATPYTAQDATTVMVQAARTINEDSIRFLFEHGADIWRFPLATHRAHDIAIHNVVGELRREQATGQRP